MRGVIERQRYRKAESYIFCAAVGGALPELEVAKIRAAAAGGRAGGLPGRYDASQPCEYTAVAANLANILLLRANVVNDGPLALLAG